ncbi:MAG: peptidylprolyl isomerase [Casimicrobiaceae bacterium]
MSTAMEEISINGVAVAGGEAGNPKVAAVRELLRQKALAEGLLAEAADDSAIDGAIDRLLDREVTTPEPDIEACRRYYDAHPQQFVSGELVAARHILFQVAQGTPVPALRDRAESTLGDLLRAPERFEALAREYSNCPSAQHGGSLGQIQRGDMVPEFEQVLFNGTWTGIHGQLVKTRYGFHIVAVDQRAPGRRVPFEAVQQQVAQRLRDSVLERALAQFVAVLAGQADVRGVDLGAAPTPLVQ